MQIEWIKAAARAGTNPCVIILPGAFQHPADVLRAGFADAVTHGRWPVDLAVVDTTLNHVTDRSLLAAIHTTVIGPLRTAGCQKVWLLGISLGGMMSLLYAARYPADVQGLYLLAPYLGTRLILSEIAEYPTLADWYAATLNVTIDGLAEERELWRYIARQAPSVPPWHLGFGRADRFAAAHRLLGQQLTLDRVDEIDGGHDWPVWRQLWERFLPRIGTRL